MASCWHFVRDTDYLVRDTCCWRYASDDDTEDRHITSEYRPRKANPNEPYTSGPDYEVVSDEDIEQSSSVADTRPHATPPTPRSMEFKDEGSDGDASSTTSSDASSEGHTRVQKLLYSSYRRK